MLTYRADFNFDEQETYCGGKIEPLLFQTQPLFKLLHFGY